jgi:hypothetical protein
MTETYDQIIASEEQAASVKAAMASVDEPKKWKASRTTTAELAAALANIPPAQGAGEAVFSMNNDGMVDVFLFYS